MSARKTKPVVLDIDLAVVGQVLERTRQALSPDDQQCLSSLVEAFIELTRLVRERGTTIARLRRLFGLKSSEKTADVLGQLQRSSKPDASDTGAPGDGDAQAFDANAAAGSESNQDAAAKTTRSGHGRIASTQYPNAGRITVAHQCLHAGDTCPDCAHSKLYRLKEPSFTVRITGQSPLAATICSSERLRCGGCGKVFTARAPDQAQGPKYDHSAAAMMALLRYGAGMPLHRLDRLQRDLKTPVPASTQWEVVSERAPALEPIYDELRRQAAQGSVLHNDDTSVRILEFMGKRRAKLLASGELPDPERTGLFTTAVVAVCETGPIALFFSGRKHAGENLALLLATRDPSLAPPIHMCDGLERNAPTDHEVVASNCLSHGRRHVVDEVENFPDQCQHVLEVLGHVFENEALCRDQGWRGQQRLEFHQRESGPLLNALKIWLNAQLDEKRVEPNSGLGTAFRYLLKRWNKLTAFLRVPEAPLDNNLCERVLKMAIRHRNNSLFYRSLRGARVGDVYMSLIFTAELHDENPFEYLTALLQHEADVAQAPATWLPWTFRATLAALAADNARRRAA